MIGLAWLLTAGLALMPGGGFAQEYVPPDPQWPVPLYHARPEAGGLFTFGEYVMFRQTNPLRNQEIAFRGFIDQDGSVTGNPGTFVGSGQPALNARQAGGPGSYQPGFEVGVGWRFRDGTTVEASWMHLVKTRYFAVASLIGGPPFGFNPGAGLENTFLTAPVFNFPLEYIGPALDLAIGAGNPNSTLGIWNAADVMSIEFNQRTEQIQAKFRKPIYETDCWRCYGLAGLRFFWIWERFKWRTVDADIFGFSSPFDVAIYTNIVSNRMYGPFVGVGQEWFLCDTPCGAFSISLDVEAAMLLNVVKQRAKYELGEKYAPPQVKRSVTDYTAVPELSAMLKLWWYPIEGVQVQVGWDAMVFFNTIAARNPVDFNFGGLAPAWERTTRVFDGFRAGIGLIF
jgi:hypothetical protein